MKALVVQKDGASRGVWMRDRDYLYVAVASFSLAAAMFLWMLSGWYPCK